MPSERPSTESEVFDVSSLDAQTKIRYILEVFDLPKDKKGNEKRKGNFLKLISDYNNAYIKSGIIPDHSTKKGRENYEAGRANLHNKIMEILTNISLSIGLTNEQMSVVTYLSEHRDEVTKMITSYFAGHEEVTINTPGNFLKMREQTYHLSGKTGPEEE